MSAISNIPGKGSFGHQLCELLKLDPKKTRNITIKVVPDDIVMVQVDQYLQDYEADKVLDLIKEYTLKEKLIPHQNFPLIELKNPKNPNNNATDNNK